MQIKPGLEEAYTTYTTVSDGEMSAYARGIVDYAVQWANKMEVAIAAGETLEQCADRCSHEADTDGITGNMYGMAAYILSAYWIHGDALKVWHNTKYGQPDAKGVVNPAVLVIRDGL